MENKSYIYSRVFLLFSFLFLVVGSVNATASFIDIPNQKFEFNYFKQVNLHGYCVGCVNDGFVLQFRNPDNNQLINVFNDEEHTNSYFTIRLLNGIVDIISNFKEVNTQVTAYGSDTAFQSQVAETFFVDIKQNQKPQQVSSPILPFLLGNQSFTYSFNGLFNKDTYDTIRVQYEDFTTLQTVNALANKSFVQTAPFCVNGDLRVCINSNGQDISLTLTGLNRTITNKTIQILATNEFGTVALAPSLSVTTAQQGAIASVPNRLPFLFAPMSLDFYESDERNLDLFWGNATYYNATFTYPSNSTNVTITSISGGGVFQSSSFDIMLSQDNIFVASKDQVINKSIFITACNEAGCNNTLGRLDFNIRVSRPDILFDAPPILMNYGEVVTLDLNNYFLGNITQYRAYVSAFDGDIQIGGFQFVFSNTTNNVTINLTDGAGIRGLSMSQFGLFSIYSSNATFNNVTGRHYKYALQSCNILCTPLETEIFNLTNNSASALYSNVILISNDQTQFGESLAGVSNVGGIWGSVARSFLDLFPPADDLTSTQKSAYVVMVMAILSLLIILVTLKMELEAKTLLYTIAVFNIILLLFFIVKGYANTFVLVTIILISIGLASAKIFGGKG